MADKIPDWLAAMRALDGTREVPGGADNPVIVGWSAEIARRFPELSSYSRTYTHDSIAWCGQTVAYVMALAGHRPPDGYLWARNWAAWGRKTEPRLGCVMVFTRGEGGHVALYESETKTHYLVRGGNQDDAINLTKIAKSRFLAARWPSDEPSAVGIPAAPVGALSDVGRSTDPSTATLHRDVPADGRPASIRYCNPGAQYPSREAARFGQLGYGLIGGGHQIAHFPSPVNGAAANFDLLARRYVGMTIGAAGTKWTGANGFGVPGYDPDAILTREMVDDPDQAIPLLKAIARREAGRGGQLTDEQWRAAHEMFRAGSADAWLFRTPEAGRRIAPAGPAKPAGAMRTAGPAVTTVPTPIALPDRPGLWRTLLGALVGRDPPVAAPPAPVARPGLAPLGDPALYDLQVMLAARGWTMVGRPDGLAGPNTAAAIRTFRAERGLPAGDHVDDELRAALAKSGPREIAASRAAATARDLRQQGSTQVQALDQIGWLGRALGLGGVVGGIAESGVLDQARETLQGVQDTAAAIGSIATTAIGVVQWCVSHWWLLAIAAGLWLVFRAATGVLRLVVLFRQGVLTRADQ
ncbi:hypothetical protein RHODGE_RHODGE_02842 [Rhodoplanes serenus]|uniref:Peptidoglycan binding-like domain-containing protein n=1 Tax=Rhodoplanes serenus TaxID=200615 RepID=A0A3S4B1V0_9BRAD|nr:TIGR02594 family protein [Rhodoplanes serenus]VCU09673.1 hypothetical protein RHODGE_RHODGE_02842 [Rhodoplanes serenus]